MSALIRSCQKASFWQRATASAIYHCCLKRLLVEAIADF
jgi:hypothetical protein